MTSLFSKYWAKQAATRTEEKLKELLLNPTDFLKVAKAVEPKAKGVTPEQIKDLLSVGKKYGIDWVQEASMNMRAGATRGAAVGMQQPIQQAPVPELPVEEMED